MRTAGEFYQAAAEKGQPEACFRLADAFARGEVVEADPILAEAWLHRAAAHGHLVARTQLEKMNIAPRPGGPVSGSKSWRAGTVAGDSVEVLCESPRIVRVSGFLNAFECAHVIQRAAPLIRPSQVLSRETGKHEASAGRRSGEARLAGPLRDVVVRRIEERLAAYAGLPVAHGERLQVLHYGPGDEYRPHVDYFDPALPGSATPLGRGGQRLVTQLCYLNDVAGGGATAFPKLGIACEARPGSMLMFFNAGADAKVDPRTQHAGLPVTAGEKWLATKWVRQLPTPAF
jgi:prolyl 4-hydroxylase